MAAWLSASCRAFRTSSTKRSGSNRSVDLAGFVDSSTRAAVVLAANSDGATSSPVALATKARRLRSPDLLMVTSVPPRRMDSKNALEMLPLAA